MQKIFWWLPILVGSRRSPNVGMSGHLADFELVSQRCGPYFTWLDNYAYLRIELFFTSWRTTHLLWQKHSTLRSRCFWQFFVQPMSDHCPMLLSYQLESENIAKGTTDPGVEWFLHKYWSIFILRISTIHQLQNLNQTSASRLNLNFKILTKPSFRISTKHQLLNLTKHQQ